MDPFQGVCEIELSQITADTDRYFVHRVDISETLVTAIKSSLASGPLLQPIVITSNESLDHYIILDGHHRYMAAQGLGWQRIPAKFVEYSQAPLVAIQANLVRNDLNALEKSISYNAWLELKQKADPAYRKTDLAREVGLSLATISQYTALHKLPQAIVQNAKENKLPLTLLYKLAISTEKDKWKINKYNTLNKNYAEWTSRKEKNINDGRVARPTPDRSETKYQKACGRVISSMRCCLKNFKSIDVPYTDDDQRAKIALVNQIIDTMSALSAFKDNVLGQDTYK